MNSDGSNKNHKILASAAVLVAMVLIVFGVSGLTSEKTEGQTSQVSPATPVAVAAQPVPVPIAPAPVLSTSSATQPEPTPVPVVSNGSGYKDGTFTATGHYDSPGGYEAITITVSLKSGVVQSTSAQNGASNRESSKYESRFVSVYPSVVIGKSISSLYLDYLSGASLTPVGFNDAIDQIKNQARG